MPNAYIQKLSDQGKGSISDLEKKWSRAKEIASVEGKSDDYAYITGIFKKMIKENLTFREFFSIIISEEGEPTTSVGSGGVDNPEGKKLGKIARRKKKDEVIKEEIHAYMNPVKTRHDDSFNGHLKYQSHSEWKKTNNMNNTLYLLKNLKVGLVVSDWSSVKPNKLIKNNELPTGKVSNIDWNNKKFTIKWESGKIEILPIDDNDKRVKTIIANAKY